MARKLSKYEQAWRERAGHAASAVEIEPAIAQQDAPEGDLVEVELVDQDPDAAAVDDPVIDLGPSALGLATGDRAVTARGEPEERATGGQLTDEDLEHLTEPPAPPAPQPLTIQFKGSSNVQGAELDPTTGIVAVTFKGGMVYRFGNFTVELMAAWQDASSAGSWFHKYVRSRAVLHPQIPNARAGAE